MRILITGGFGFVGGRLAVHLAKFGYQVVLGSRKASRPPVWLPQIEAVNIVWEDDDKLQRSCSGVDVVIHAAGMNAQDCAADPVAALAFNGVATSRLISAANRAGVQRFIYLSTAHVYASPLVGLITEKTCPRNLHPYATSHLAGEHAVSHADQCGPIHGIILRLSNAFGAPAHKDVNCWMLLVNDLCMQAVQTGKLVLQTNGLQKRDFLSLTDLCLIVEHLCLDKKGASQRGVFNVGSGTSQTVLQMAQLIQQRCQQMLGFEPELLFATDTPDNRNIDLTFRADRLAETGFGAVRNDIGEIDRLLQFCKLNFIQLPGQAK